MNLNRIATAAGFGLWCLQLAACCTARRPSKEDKPVAKSYVEPAESNSPSSTQMKLVASPGAPAGDRSAFANKPVCIGDMYRQAVYFFPLEENGKTWTVIEGTGHVLGVFYKKPKWGVQPGFHHWDFAYRFEGETLMVKKVKWEAGGLKLVGNEAATLKSPFKAGDTATFTLGSDDYRLRVTGGSTSNGHNSISLELGKKQPDGKFNSMDAEFDANSSIRMTNRSDYTSKLMGFKCFDPADGGDYSRE